MRSLLNKNWKVAEPDSDVVEKLAKDLGCTKVLARLLVLREVTDPEAAEQFLQADLKNLHDPFLMLGMDRAVERVVQAIERKEKITVFGDYDVDGVTSTALLVHFFRELEAPHGWYLPDRQKEGYGVNENALKQIHADGSKLVITCDCGITAVKEVAFAKTLGLDVIITDHHQVGQEGLPDAVSVLNPHQPDCTYPYRFLSGVGIAFKLAAGVRRKLHETGWPADRLPNLKRHLDLFALGTIADMAPLTGENHTLSRHGLMELETTTKPGLVAMKSVADASGRIDAQTVGFKLGPRLNAAGRLGKADPGLHLLISTELNEAMDRARQLEELNRERRTEQAENLKLAEYMAEREVDLEKDRVIVLGSDDFHPGVVGLVASKMVDRFYRPAILIAFRDGIGKGSARSIPTFHLHRAMTECSKDMIQFGGHAYAAGLTIQQEQLDAFRQSMNAIGHRHLSEEHLVPEVRIDSELNLDQVNWELYNELQALEPFGQVNPTPVFLSRKVTLQSYRMIGKDKSHVRATFREGSFVIECIAFQMAEVFKQLEEGALVDIVFELQRNDFSGKPKLELMLKDIRS